MTTSNVLTQGLNGMTSGSADRILSKQQTGSGFGQVMRDSLYNQLGNQKSNTEAVVKTSSPKQFASKPVAKEQDKTAVEDKKTVVQTEENSKALAETAQKIKGEIKELVKKELGLTEEELEAAMEVLGLEYIELLLPENMKALVLEVNQTDAMELLTNEDLANQLNQLLQGTEGILSQAGIELSPEELEGLLESFQEAMNEVQTEEAALQSEKLTKEQPEIEIKVEKSEETLEEANTVQATNNASGATETTLNQKDMQQEAQDSETKKEDIHTTTEDNTLQNPLDAIIQNLSNHISTENVSMTATQRTEMMQDIVNQVLEQLRVNIRNDATSMEMTLNPENLGKVNLTVVSKEGHLTASFTVQNQVTKEALESQIQTLKENLNNQGVKVDAIEVNIQSFAFDERNQMSGGQGGNNEQSKPRERKLTAEDIQKAFAEDSVVEEAVPDTVAITQSGSNIDYTA